MKKSLFNISSILPVAPVEDEIEVIDLEAALVDIIDGNVDLREAILGLDEAVAKHDSLDAITDTVTATLEFLENELSDITQAALNFVDRDGQLAELASLETIVFTTDEEKQQIVAACEAALKEQSANAWATVVRVFKFLLDKVISFFKIVFSQRERYDRALKALKQAIDAMTKPVIDEKMNVSVVAAKTWGTAAGQCSDLIKLMSSGDISKVAAELKKQGENVELMKLEKTEGTLVAAGWKVGNISSTVEHAGAMVAGIAGLKGIQKSLQDSLAAGIKDAEALAKGGEGNDDKKAKTKALQADAKLCTKTLNAVISQSMRLAAQALALGKMVKEEKAA